MTDQEISNLIKEEFLKAGYHEHGAVGAGGVFFQSDDGREYVLALDKEPEAKVLESIKKKLPKRLGDITFRTILPAVYKRGKMFGLVDDQN